MKQSMWIGLPIHSQLQLEVHRVLFLLFILLTRRAPVLLSRPESNP